MLAKCGLQHSILQTIRVGNTMRLRAAMTACRSMQWEGGYFFALCFVQVPQRDLAVDVHSASLHS